MEDLFEQGYEVDQINQILKIEKSGYKISKKITPAISIETLRKLRPILENSKYTNREKGLILNRYVAKNEDITSYIDMGFNSASIINVIKKLEELKYDISKLKNKGYDYQKLNVLYYYYKNGHDVLSYIDKGYGKSEIGLRLKTEQFGIDYDKTIKDYPDAKWAALLRGFDKGINALPYITKKYTSYQIDSVITALEKHIDVKKVTKVNAPGCVMDVIISGLEKGYDITPYITTRTNKQLAKVILSCLEDGINPNEVLKFNNHKTAKLAYELLKKSLDTTLLDETKYDYAHLKFIKTLLIKYSKNKKVDIKRLCNNDIMVNQLEIALDLMKNGYDPKALLITNFSIYDITIIRKAIMNNIDITPYIKKGIGSREINSLICLLEKGYKITK